MMKAIAPTDQLKLLQRTIDRSIKLVWLNYIKKDYQHYYLLKEDTLKNSFYYHLRNQLTDKFLDKNRIRIFTEFYYKDGIADIAIVQLKEQLGLAHLRDEVEQVLAVIELKFKWGGNGGAFEQDVLKIQQYLKTRPLDHTQFYLAFIHESEYEEDTVESWLTARQQKWAAGRVTELSSWYVGDELVWKVFSYNGLNEEIYFDNRELISNAALDFNEEKYPQEIYDYFLNVVANAKSVTEELRKAVEFLLYWKLGKISAVMTPSSVPISWSDKWGRPYYLLGTTDANKNAIDKALTEEMLQSGQDFKNNMITYDSFKNRVSDITKTSIVLPTFFTHIWKPAEYPILDVKVWRSYLWMNGFEINKYSKPLSWRHYEDYTNFFRKLGKETGIEWRDLDKGLWVLGDKVRE